MFAKRKLINPIPTALVLWHTTTLYTYKLHFLLIIEFVIFRAILSLHIFFLNNWI